MATFQKGTQRNGNGAMDDQNHSTLHGTYHYFYRFKFLLIFYYISLVNCIF